MKKEIELRALFRAINLDILQVMKRKYLPPNTFPFEEKPNLIEYRVELGKILDEEWFMDMYGVEKPTIQEYKKEYGEDVYLDDFIKDKNRIGTLESLDNGRMEFSVFLPLAKDLKSPLFLNKIWVCAVNYLSLMFHSFPKVFGDLKNKKKDLIESNSAILEDTEGFSSLLNKVGINITNDNLYPIEHINYRLYKDNKFFNEVYQHCIDSNFDYFEFIQEAKKICK